MMLPSGGAIGKTSAREPPVRALYVMQGNRSRRQVRRDQYLDVAVSVAWTPSSNGISFNRGMSSSQKTTLLEVTTVEPGTTPKTGESSTLSLISVLIPPL